jgi:tripartite ATP-independent transporter DctM subunit
MDPVILACLVLALVLVLIAFRVPVAYALGVSASLGLLIFFSWRPGSGFDLVRGLRPALSILTSSPFEFVSNYELSMIPLFIALGHVAYAAGITTDLYYALRIWLARVPGGLALASVVGCGGFSAITGSSVACASAMGRIAVPEMLRYGYDSKLATGAVAAGGTLGSLIPPSLLFVIYAIFTEQSVKDLFLAGILPGLISLLGYMITIVIWSKLRPNDAPPPKELTFSRADRMVALIGVWPVVILLAVIIVGIYGGFFTPTEAAAVSLAVATVIGFLRRRLTLRSFVDALRETVLQTSMIFLIAIGAKIFVSFVSLTRVSPSFLDWLQSTHAPLVIVMAAIVLLYIVLGMFLDSIGILVLTLPFTVPLVEGYHLDMVWFGVVVIKLLEIGLITPPIGLNVFVIKSVAPPRVSLEDVFKGACWFLLLDFVVLLLILLFPSLSLLIPRAAF